MDCTPVCRLASHADVVLSAVTREQLDEIKCFVKYFCGNGGRVCDSFGRNAVHVAASCGKKDVLKWLIEQGQQEEDHGNDGIIGVKDGESGWTALHRSCFYGYLSCALLLLQVGKMHVFFLSGQWLNGVIHLVSEPLREGGGILLLFCTSSEYSHYTITTLFVFYFSLGQTFMRRIVKAFHLWNC